MIAPQLLELFEGDSSQHLLVTLTGDQKDSGKRNAEYKTVYSAVTAELWQKHLNGEIIIGVKPELNDKAKWGCIDVDPSSYKDFKSKKFGQENYGPNRSYVKSCSISVYSCLLW